MGRTAAAKSGQEGPPTVRPGKSEWPRRVTAPPGRRRARVLCNRAAGRYRLIEVDDDAGPRRPTPGQFYMLASAEGWLGDDGRPWLARPFSHVRSEPLAFLIDPVGPGSRRLAALQAGQEVHLVGPLGQGFRPPAAGATALLVGGGIGIAPLGALAQRLGGACEALLGFKDALAAEAAALVAARRVALATDDGSLGHHGLVTDLLALRLEAGGAFELFACGPEPMLRAVAEAARAANVPAQLAFEAPMACGFGACFGCAFETQAGWMRLCLEGPVVDARDLP